MTIQELRVEALRAAVELERLTFAPSPQDALLRADRIFQWLFMGKLEPTHRASFAPEGRYVQCDPPPHTPTPEGPRTDH